MASFKGITSLLIAGALSLAVAGCGRGEGEEPAAAADGDVVGDRELGDDVSSVSSELISCPSGYHAHYVDWSSTRVDPLGSCPPRGLLLTYGTPFCMSNSNQGVSCNGEWMVLGKLKQGAFEYIKIRALNGH
jgi:hypothetical protein